MVAAAALPDVELVLESELAAIAIVVDGRVVPEKVLVSEALEEDEAAAAEGADEGAAEDEDELEAAAPSIVPNPIRGQ